MLVLADVSKTDVVIMIGVVLTAFFLMAAAFVFGIWLRRLKDAPSLYTKLPMRRGSEVSYEMKVRVLRYLYDLQEYDNRIFEFSKAAVCRDTGRIFQDCVTWYDRVKLDWSYLQKRCPGHFVSWGSLTTDQQEIVRDNHVRIDDFQTAFSCPSPSPRDVTSEYVYKKPGPLYVDIETMTLLGWKVVPDTDLEVLIVQRPKQIIQLSINLLE